MARPLYSTAFYSNPSFNTLQIVGPVPAGHIWIVRDIDCEVPLLSPFLVAPRLEIDDSTLGMIFHTPPLSLGSTPYQWRGRQVLEPGSEIQINPNGGTWNVRISGYTLTSP